jgi:hypothetical protein
MVSENASRATKRVEVAPNRRMLSLNSQHQAPLVALTSRFSMP